MAIKQANQSGGINGRMVELLVRDDTNDPSVAAAAVHELHAAGVDAIIGPNISAIAEGMLPALNELSMVTVSPTVSSLVFADRDDYLFRINWTTRDNAKVYARHYLDAGIRRIAAAVDANNRVFSESWLDEFTAEFTAGGGEVIGSEAFDSTRSDSYAQTALALVDMKAEALLLIANSVDTAQLTQQIRKIDSDVLLIAAEWAASERLITLGGKAIEGIELVQSYNRNDQSDRYLAFRTAYRDHFQAEPDYASVAAYDAATVLFKAFRQLDEHSSLKDSLLNLGEVEGLQQPISFNAYGDAQRRAFFVVVRDGQFQLK